MTMNGLPGNAARGAVGSSVGGINIGGAGRPGMDRGGPGGAQLGQPAANTGMQRGAGNLNAALFLNNQVEFSVCLAYRYNAASYRVVYCDCTIELLEVAQ